MSIIIRENNSFYRIKIRKVLVKKKKNIAVTGWLVENLKFCENKLFKPEF